MSTQTPELGDVVRVRVRVPSDFGPVHSIRTRSNPDHEPHFTDATLVASTGGWDWWEAPLRVENPVHGYRFLFVLEDGSTGWLGSSGYSLIETRDSEDFKFVSYPAPPPWAKNTVMYQIFPDRFARSSEADGRELPIWAEPAEWTDEPIHIGPSTARQFYGGDLLGIEQKLDHLVDLGVTMVYLTPVFPAHSNHRYDALSFTTVDPLLGGDDALISLVDAAHARGLSVIGDLTSNHSGDAHEWFTSSHLTPGAPESEFYYWLDPEQKSYVSWLGVPSLPKFNWAAPELRRRFIEGEHSVVAKWLKAPYNFDGWRIDVANMTGRYLDQDLNAEVRQTIRKTMIDVNPDTILLGESTNDALGDFEGDGWHGAMTYANFTRPIWGWLSKRVEKSWFFGLPYGTIPSYTGLDVFEAHQRFAAGFPWRVRLHNMNALDTHDTARFRTSALDGAVPVAFGMSVTLPGIPVVFAGDEFGLVGDDGEHSRSPMPWDERDASASTIDLYTQLIHLRRDHVALNEGGIRWLHAGEDVLVYVREHADECVLVVAARAAFDVEVELDGHPELLWGETDATDSRLWGDGPSFTVWRLPGIVLPSF
ncbi:glycoside hydrolase family 13 protein [Glaciihabitans arcticus]|uniref:glycoside hydrolase family 13 protein n=1 Tax=Glaciihabitans arcticus TaxID=2668039 RepID=UPI001F021E54|nr:glycoside hydrolase family 13 protein [Glaciihabitans arcticus]